MLIVLSVHADAQSRKRTDLLTAWQVPVQADHSGPCQLEQHPLHLSCFLMLGLAACPPGWHLQALLSLFGRKLQSLAALAAPLSQLFARCQTPVANKIMSVQHCERVSSHMTGCKVTCQPCCVGPGQAPCNIHMPVVTCSNTDLTVNVRQLLTNNKKLPHKSCTAIQLAMQPACSQPGKQ